MEFYSDWLVPRYVDRRTGEADYFSSPKGTRHFTTNAFGRVLSPDNRRGGHATIERRLMVQPHVCGDGIHRHFHVDARKVKRIRVQVSDEPFDGSKRAEPCRGVLSNMGAPPIFTRNECRTIYWAVETEE